MPQLNITVNTEDGNKYFSVANKYSDILNAYTTCGEAGKFISNVIEKIKQNLANKADLHFL